MARRVAILGSTGSVGVQALDVLRQRPEEKVYALSAGHNIDLLREQIAEFQPERVVLLDSDGAQLLRREFSHVEICDGAAALAELASDPQIDLVLSAIVGLAGIAPLLNAIKGGKTVALANKEPLAAAGELLMAEVQRYGATLLPVDSEHSAIFQCLHGSREAVEVDEIILTASGGPFRDRPQSDLAEVTPEEASRHPRWRMGAKISIDSATMVNKGLEMIEARWLFNVLPEQIRVVIHPESIVHSMVAFRDGAILAQLGLPDMRLPIAYALSWPERWDNDFPRLDWSTSLSLHFEPPDKARFAALSLAQQAMKMGGTLPAVFNGANEAAVQAFREHRLRFDEIVTLVERVMQQHQIMPLRDIADIIEADYWAAQQVIAALSP